MKDLSLNTNGHETPRNTMSATHTQTTPLMGSIRPSPYHRYDSPMSPEPQPTARSARRLSEPFTCTHCGGDRYYLVLHAEALTNTGGLRLTCSTCEASHALYDAEH